MVVVLPCSRLRRRRRRMAVAPSPLSQQLLVAAVARYHRCADPAAPWSAASSLAPHAATTAGTIAAAVATILAAGNQTVLDKSFFAAIRSDPQQRPPPCVSWFPYQSLYNEFYHHDETKSDQDESITPTHPTKPHFLTT